MPDLPLYVRKDLASIGLIPAPVQVFGRQSQLDKEIAGQVLRFGLAALFAPKADQRRLVIAHDDPGVRAADEATPAGLAVCANLLFHGFFFHRWMAWLI